jgi:hypothetical protein
MNIKVQISQDGSVSIVTALHAGVTFPAGANRLWGPSSLAVSGRGMFSPEGKAVGV